MTVIIEIGNVLEMLPAETVKTIEFAPVDSPLFIEDLRNGLKKVLDDNDAEVGNFVRAVREDGDVIAIAIKAANEIFVLPDTQKKIIIIPG